MSETQPGNGASRPSTQPQLAVVAPPIEVESTPNGVSVQIPSRWLKWAKENFVVLLLGAYVGNDVLQGYINAPQDIADIKTQIQALDTKIDTENKAFRERLEAIERAIVELTKKTPATVPSR